MPKVKSVISSGCSRWRLCGACLAFQTAGLTRAMPTLPRTLARLRFNRIAALQTVYLALHDLVLGPWYSDPATWHSIGYPGPLALASGTAPAAAT